MTTSILPSLKGSIRTHNTTSFAVGYGDAQALILDALALTGTARKEKLSFARSRVTTALAYADLVEEKILAQQTLAVLNFYDQRGLNV